MEIKLIQDFFNSFNLPGFGLFLFFFYKAIDIKIKSLIESNKQQKETMETIKARATEVETLLKTYKNSLSDYEQSSIKRIQIKDDLITDYEAILKRKDDNINLFAERLRSHLSSINILIQTGKKAEDAGKTSVCLKKIEKAFELIRENTYGLFEPGTTQKIDIKKLVRDIIHQIKVQIEDFDTSIEDDGNELHINAIESELSEVFFILINRAANRKNVKISFLKVEESGNECAKICIVYLGHPEYGVIADDEFDREIREEYLKAKILIKKYNGDINYKQAKKTIAIKLPLKRASI